MPNYSVAMGDSMCYLCSMKRVSVSVNVKVRKYCFLFSSVAYQLQNKRFSRHRNFAEEMLKLNLTADYSDCTDKKRFYLNQPKRDKSVLICEIRGSDL